MKELKIITSNIRFANPSDGLNDWPHRLPQLSKLYSDFAPDVLGTQEGRQEQLNELDVTLKDLVLIDSHRSWIKERMYPCLFINPQTISIERSGDVWLSETPHVNGSHSFQSAFPRLFTWAEVTVIESGIKLMLVNTHLDHILSETRFKQTEVLIAEIKKINQRPLMLMGDFNESPATSIQQIIREAFSLKDPWAEKNYKEETSHHSFLGHKNLEGDRIDWILIPKEFECVDLKMIKESSSEGHYPSDHYPIFATVIPK
jgi:endonuclease/exonuclease/phosphatase family metal-dependent hydrolase